MYLPEDYQPSRTAVIVSVIVLSIGLGGALYIGVKRNLALSGEVRYTIGYTNGFQLTSSGRDVKYSYTVNGETYEDVATYAYNSKPNGGRYLVRFSVEHPEMSELYQNKPAPRNIKAPPPEGWQKRPWW